MLKNQLKRFALNTGLALPLIAGAVVTVPARNSSTHSTAVSDNTAVKTIDAIPSAFIIKEVRHELVTLPYYNLFDWLEFEVDADGVVTLKGQVTRPGTKSDAANRVKEIDGVMGVNNQIEVLPLSPNDDRLRAALYRSIYGANSPLFRYATQVVPPIHLIVKNGRATLKGVVADKGESDLAYLRANSVSGLFEVRNELRLEKIKVR